MANGTGARAKPGGRRARASAPPAGVCPSGFTRTRRDSGTVARTRDNARTSGGATTERRSHRARVASIIAGRRHARIVEPRTQR